MPVVGGDDAAIVRMQGEEEVEMAQQTVGMIGLGIMGSAMSFNLGRAGFRVAGYDVAPKRRAEHARSGGIVARSPREVARRTSIIVTSLPSAKALAETAAQLAASARRGTIVIETSTLPIPVKQNARDALAKRGVVLLDCPLSGTGAQARVKDLLIYVSGDRAAYRSAVPVLAGFTSANYYVGPFGNGSKMKFVANLLVAIHNVAAAEAMVLGMKAGLDPALVLKVVAGGAGGSRMFQVRGPMMVKGDYSEATMKNEVWQKDMSIIGDFARELDCPTPLFAASAPIYNAAMAMGLGKEDTGAVCAVLEEMAGNPRRGKRRRR
ncbi:MAG TPA: NAD(P)-dependent oxidoreductase [Burkholderiales bacterium]